MSSLASIFRLPAYPTPRLALAFAAGSAWFFAIPWFGLGFLWLGIGYNLAILALAVLDFIRLKDSSQCTVRRECGQTLSVGDQNPIWIEVDNKGNTPVKVSVRDEYPLQFHTAHHILTMDVLPSEIQRKNYKVVPPERGDYRFGDLNVRFMTSLGLVMIQKKIPCELSVKVYPDVLQTKKQLLLLRENRIAQMGIRRSRIHGQGQEFVRLRD